MSWSALRFVFVTALALAIAPGCGDDASTAPDADVSGDASSDADATPPPDADPDAGADAAPDVDDAGFDADPDVPADQTTPDATGDADAAADAPDAATDADDAGPELPPTPECGDGHLDDGEDCDDGAANSDTEPDACRTDCVAAHCGDGVVDGGETCDDGNDNPYDGCTPSCEPGAGLTLPLPGDIVIAELMVNPQAVNDPHGEWIELVNTTDALLNLTDCVLVDDATDLVLIASEDGPIGLEPGARFVLGFSGEAAKNGGVEVDYVYATMLLDNFVDSVTLACDDVVIDSVSYGAGDWPVASGVAMALDPTKTDGALNDSPFSWCPASTPYGAGDLGTPGAPNDPCPVPDTTVDLCVLVGPAQATGFVGHPLRVDLTVFEAGLTDATPGVDTPAALKVEVGHAPAADAADPGSWQWTAAEPATGWVDLDGVDAWTGLSLPFEAVGQRVAAARASRDGGLTWTLCDRDPGSADGFDPADATAVTVVADPCEADPCTDAPAPACQPDGVTLWTFPGEAACVPTAADAFECEWLPSAVDCAAQGQVCADAACAGAAVAPLAGEVAFTELLVTPEAGATPWVEVTNLATHPVDLQGCLLTSGTSVHTLNKALVLGVDARIVLAASADPTTNGGLPASYSWGSGLTIAKTGPGVTLTCGGAIVDQVAWTSKFSFATGVSNALSPFHLSAQGNDDLGAWCGGVGTVGLHTGTPGDPNPPCPGDVEPVDACWVAGEATLTAPAGTDVAVQVRFTEAGLTDAGPDNSAAESILVQVGVAAAGTAATSSQWQWADAAPVADWDATEADEAKDVDAWAGSVRLRGQGTLALAGRVSVDGGHSWTVCDLDPETAYDPVEAPLVEATDSPCWPDPCGADPGTVCLDDVLVGDVTGPASCVVDGDAAACTWPAAPGQDCAALGASCALGECVDFPLPPAAGEVVLTELMIVPLDPTGEWVELTNVTDAPLDLAGCVLSSAPSEGWTLPAVEAGTFLVWPGEAVVLARTADAAALAGVVPDAVWSGLALSNTADSLALTCGEAVVDAVAWDTQSGWGVPAFTTLSLSADATDAADNDLPASWCAGGPAADGAPAGTPGQANPVCD